VRSPTRAALREASWELSFKISHKREKARGETPGFLWCRALAAHGDL
jgi:hypothetical protein